LCDAFVRGSTVIIASMPEEGIFGPMMIYQHITPERDNLVRGLFFIPKTRFKILQEKRNRIQVLGRSRSSIF
jgi:hypothetical protein